MANAGHPSHTYPEKLAGGEVGLVRLPGALLVNDIPCSLNSE
jgi:hypothetical protein